MQAMLLGSDPVRQYTLVVRLARSMSHLVMALVDGLPCNNPLVTSGWEMVLFAVEVNRRLAYWLVEESLQYGSWRYVLLEELLPLEVALLCSREKQEPNSPE
jgi:hypothetical protein